jgi:hypothetical protein
LRAKETLDDAAAPLQDGNDEKWSDGLMAIWPRLAYHPIGNATNAGVTPS